MDLARPRAVPTEIGVPKGPQIPERRVPGLVQKDVVVADEWQIQGGAVCRSREDREQECQPRDVGATLQPAACRQRGSIAWRVPLHTGELLNARILSELRHDPRVI